MKRKLAYSFVTAVITVMSASSMAMSAFAEKTDNLKVIMNQIVDSIEGIAKASEESAQAVISSSGNTNTLVDKISDIDKEMQASVGAINGFKDEIDVFSKY